MAEETSTNDFEVYCVYCNKQLSDEDEIHFTCGPYGYDIDVMCGECMARSKQMAAAGPIPGLSDELAATGDPFDLLAGSDLGDPTAR